MAPLRPVLAAALRVFWLIKFVKHHRRLPLQPTRRFNDFLFSIKAGREIANPLRAQVTDKAHGKTFIAERLGPDLTPRTWAVLRNAEDLVSYRPPSYPAMAKPTHSSGRFIKISSADEYVGQLSVMQEWLQHDYFLTSLERHYEGLEKKVIIEEFISDSFWLEGSVHCRHGHPRIISLIDRYTKQRQSFRADRAPLGVSLGYPFKELKVEDWRFFDGLLVHCKTLAKPFSYIRVDFYTDGQSLLFGELTSLPAGANGKFYPDGGEAIFSKAFFGQ
jgi:hypothetical protein